MGYVMLLVLLQMLLLLLSLLLLVPDGDVAIVAVADEKCCCGAFIRSAARLLPVQRAGLLGGAHRHRTLTLKTSGRGSA